MRIVVTASVLLALTPPASAYETVKDFRYEKREDFKALNKIYLSGISSGLQYYNAYLVSKNQPPAFCLPGKLALTDEQAEDIMLRWVDESPKYRNTLPIALSLQSGLTETFPCGR
jgi:hypothetical protein